MFHLTSQYQLRILTVFFYTDEGLHTRNVCFTTFYDTFDILIYNIILSVMLCYVMLCYVMLCYVM